MSRQVAGLGATQWSRSAACPPPRPSLPAPPPSQASIPSLSAPPPPVVHAVKFHYQFNLRELSAVTLGLCRMTRAVFTEPLQVLCVAAAAAAATASCSCQRC